MQCYIKATTDGVVYGSMLIVRLLNTISPEHRSRKRYHAGDVPKHSNVRRHQTLLYLIKGIHLTFFCSPGRHNNIFAGIIRKLLHLYCIIKDGLYKG